MVFFGVRCGFQNVFKMCVWIWCSFDRCGKIVMIYQSVFQNRMKIITWLTTSDWPICSYMDIKQQWQVNCLGKGLQVSFKTCYHHFDPQERTDHLNGWWAIGEDDITSSWRRWSIWLVLGSCKCFQTWFCCILSFYSTSLLEVKTLQCATFVFLLHFRKNQVLFSRRSPQNEACFPCNDSPLVVLNQFSELFGATLRDKQLGCDPLSADGEDKFLSMFDDVTTTTVWSTDINL